jgi:hypothetical protein
MFSSRTATMLILSVLRQIMLHPPPLLYVTIASPVMQSMSAGNIHHRRINASDAASVTKSGGFLRDNICTNKVITVD